MKNMYAAVLAIGLFMNSANSMYSSDENEKRNQVIIGVVATAITSYIFYRLGSLSAHNSSVDSHNCIDMKLVEARFKLKKTGLNLSSDLSKLKASYHEVDDYSDMPPLELTDEAQQELQEKRAIQKEIEKYHAHYKL